MTKIAGMKERGHRAFFSCTCCSEDPRYRCPKCGFWFCEEHLNDHDCVALLRATAEKRLDDLAYYGGLIDNAFELAEKWEEDAARSKEEAMLGEAAYPSMRNREARLRLLATVAASGARAALYLECARRLRRALHEGSVDESEEAGS